MNGKRVKLIRIIEDFQKYPENICINGSIEKIREAGLVRIRLCLN